ncbi:MAG: fasciclin domain-containing protein [Granulosicoccus sp.]
MIRIFFAVTLMSALTLTAGCSSSNNDDTGGADADASGLPDQGDGNNLIDTLIADTDHRFTQLLSAIETASLGDVFGDVGNSFTLMAPTNAAFDAVPAADLEALLEDIPRLTRTLFYHALPTNTDVFTLTAAVGSELATVAGTGVAIETGMDAGGNATLRYGEANVTSTAGIVAENGIVHIVDKLLIAP